MSNQLSKTEVLLIRACKSEKPLQRVRSVYKRQYHRGIENPVPAMAIILTNLCEKVVHYPISKLVEDMNPIHHWRFALPEDHKYHDIVLGVMISKIRLMSVEGLEGWVSPLQFRK